MTAGNRHIPVILFLIPFAAVLFGIFIVLVALVFPDDVVVDDYYKDGMAINVRLDEEEKARALGIEVLGMELLDRGLSVEIAGADEAGLELSLFHVTDKSSDWQAILTRQPSGLYSAGTDSAAQLGKAGVWYVEISSQERGWKWRDRITTPLTSAGGSHE